MNKNWFIGIDVSKKTLDASIFVAGEVINRFPHIQVRNEKQGFKELLRWAKEQGVNTKDALFGLEFTGYYSDALEQFLTGKKLYYTMLPTTVVKHYQRGTRDKGGTARLTSVSWRVPRQDGLCQNRRLPVPF